MQRGRKNLSGTGGFLVAASASLVAAGILAISTETERLPVLGSASLFWVTALAAFAGLPLLVLLQRHGIAATASPPEGKAVGVAGLLALGAALSVPPVLVDLALPFPRDMNIGPPEAFLIYPAIALVAETAFHLFPMALLAALLPKGVSKFWCLLPTIFVEPIFQSFYATGPLAQSWLVFAIVSLISATQLWLFARQGFGAMLVLRLSYYLFWHLLWGSIRLSLLF